MSVQNVKLTFTPAEQTELKARLAAAKTQEERVSIYNQFKQECGIVDNNAVDSKGLSVEKNCVDEKNVKKRETTTSVNVEDLLKEMQIEDDSAKSEFKKFLADNKIQIDDKGDIKWTSPEQKSFLEQTLSKYAHANMKESLVFTKETDQALIDKLVQDGTISKNADGTYNILDKAKLEAVLVNKESETTEQLPPQELSVKSTSVTKTEVEEGVVEPSSKDLKHDKAARNKLKADLTQEVEKWANEPENQSIMNISIAKDKYAKDINKQAAKIAKEYDGKKSDIELLKDYYKNYATDDQKTDLNNTLNVLNSIAFDEDPNASDKQKQHAQNLQKSLVDALNKGTNSSYFKLEDLSDPSIRKDAILFYMTQNGDFNKNVMINRMATVDVMGARSEKQIAKDKKEWIKDEVERQAKAIETNQNIDNTKVHLTKDMRKAAQKGETDKAIEHTDIGDYGRKLFQKAPTFFGEPVNDVKGEGDFFSDNDGNEYFKGEDGKYYKFNEKLFDEFCAYACSGNVEKLSDEAKKRFGVDGNVTLKEGRDFLRQKIFRIKDENGNMQYRSLEQIMDPKGGDGKVSNRDLNKFLNFVKKNGSSADTNSTDVKRGLHIGKGMLIGAALGFGTGFLGSSIAGAISFLGQGATQFIDYSADYAGVTDDRVFSGVTDPQTIHDKTTFKYEVNGETFSKTVNKNITVDGQEWSVVAPGQEYGGTVNGTQVVDGQQVSGKVKQNNWKNGANAAIFGGVAGGITNAISAGKVEAQGRNFDGIVDLKRTVTKTDEPQDGKLNLNIRKTRTVTVRSGQIGEKIGFKPCKLRVKNINSNLNRGETMESMVAEYYKVPIGSPEHKLLMEKVKEFNKVKKFGGFNYTADNIFNLPDKIIVDGHTWTRQADPSDPKERLQLATQDIILGGRRGSEKAQSSEIDNRLYGKGRITKS